jgi:hypothetical protein
MGDKCFVFIHHILVMVENKELVCREPFADCSLRRERSRLSKVSKSEVFRFGAGPSDVCEYRMSSMWLSVMWVLDGWRRRVPVVR